MDQKYTAADHGDLLEKKGAAFIRNQFPNYELVWQTYIGNTGNATMAPLPNYPDERKRQSFAEQSYTTFESCFMIQHLLDSGILTAEIASADDYIRFNQAFILFFTYLGRIHDTMLKAAKDLGYHYQALEQKLKDFYDARNIILHGKKVPIMLDQDGKFIMPALQTRYAKGNTWSDKANTWADAAEMKSVVLIESCEAYFSELMKVINTEYGTFYGVIMRELRQIPTQLVFDRSNEGIFSGSLSNRLVPPSSGSTRVAVNVYNINDGLTRDKR